LLYIFCKLIPVGSIIRVKEVHEACFYIHDTTSKQCLKSELLTRRKHIQCPVEISENIVWERMAIYSENHRRRTDELRGDKDSVL
jgi:hypothetical protein